MKHLFITLASAAASATLVLGAAPAQADTATIQTTTRTFTKCIQDTVNGGELCGTVARHSDRSRIVAEARRLQPGYSRYVGWSRTFLSDGEGYVVVRSHLNPHRFHVYAAI